MPSSNQAKKVYTSLETIACSEAYKFATHLLPAGVDVIPIEFSACYPFGGALNCYTLDIHRRAPWGQNDMSKLLMCLVRSHIKRLRKVSGVSPSQYRFHPSQSCSRETAFRQGPAQKSYFPSLDERAEREEALDAWRGAPSLKSQELQSVASLVECIPGRFWVVFPGSSYAQQSRRCRR